MFKVIKFEQNSDADTACKQFFSKVAPHSKQKNKVKDGKVAKKPVKNGKLTKKVAKNSIQNEEKIKDEIRAILQNNVDLVHTKIKTKKKKKKQKAQEKQTMVQKQEVKSKETTQNKQNLNNVVQNKAKKRKKTNIHEKQRTMVQKEVHVKNKETTQNEQNNVVKRHKAKKRQKKNIQEKQIESEKTVPVTSENKAQQKKKRKRKTKKQIINHNGSSEATYSVKLEETEGPLDYKQKKKEKLKEKLQKTLTLVPEKKQKSKNLSLRERMMQKLQAARFRYINEQIYSSDSKEAQKIFKEDPEAFEAYHEGYRQQVNKWPLNPVDVIIKNIQKLPKTHTVADFGCGDAKLAKSVAQKVHSFDLVAANDLVTACDMAHVPLQNGSVDVVVFCLSLMGTNLHEYLSEANRVLKPEGILKIAEVESRFDDINQFIEALKRFNFKNTWSDLSHNLFYFLDFKKEANIKQKRKLPRVSLNPCLYKKR